MTTENLLLLFFVSVYVTLGTCLYLLAGELKRYESGYINTGSWRRQCHINSKVREIRRKAAHTKLNADMRLQEVLSRGNV